MAGEHGGVADILRDHGFCPKPVSSDKNQIAGFVKEVQGEGTFNDVAFDLGWPSPFVVHHGLELLDLRRNAGAVPYFAGGDPRASAWASLFQQHARGPGWERVASARKSSRLAASARRPICCSCAARLFLGWIVVAGELIVGLQVVRLYVDGFELGMTAEIDCHGRRRAQFPLAFTHDRKATEDARAVPLLEGASRMARPSAGAP